MVTQVRHTGHFIGVGIVTEGKRSTPRSVYMGGEDSARRLCCTQDPQTSVPQKHITTGRIGVAWHMQQSLYVLRTTSSCLSFSASCLFFSASCLFFLASCLSSASIFSLHSALSPMADDEEEEEFSSLRRFE